MPTARLPIDAAHRAATSDAHAIGAVTGLTDALAAGRSEVLSSVTVLSTDHPATWTADAATDVLTSSDAHGLTVNTPIAFGAGTGALPAGLSPEPEYYYVIEVPTTTTLKVSLTHGGTAVDITSAGTAGWVVKNLPVATTNGNLSFPTLDISTDGDIECYFLASWAKKNPVGSYPRLDAGLGSAWYTSWVTGGVGSQSCGTASGLHAKKYNRTLTTVRLRAVSTGVATVEMSFYGVTSDTSNLASPAAVGVNGSGWLTYSNASRMMLYDGYGGYFLSGATARAVRRP